MTVLFNSGKNGQVSKHDVINALKKVKADECDVLYIHTDMTFGLPSQKRNILLAELYDAIASLNVKTLIFPTFTFSFCNQEIFDVRKTPTKMGALNEYVRKNVNGTRTSDPLLSVFVIGDEKNFTNNLGHYSIGENSNYDRIRACSDEVRFLFLGADMRQCFTYTHYMESVFSVPYRYNREFEGTIIDENGIAHEHEKYFLFSSYSNTRLNTIPVVYNEMNSRNLLKTVDLGDSGLQCFSKNDATCVISDLLSENIFCLTDGSFKEEEKNYIYNPNNEYIVSVK